MNMMQVGVVGILGVLLAVQLKGAKAEYGIYIGVAVSILLFACIVDRLEFFVQTVKKISRYVSAGTEYMAVILKMLGITYIAEFCGSICRDAGHQTIAVQIEIFSKLTVLALGTPVLLALLETIQEFLT